MQSPPQDKPDGIHNICVEFLIAEVPTIEMPLQEKALIDQLL